MPVALPFERHPAVIGMVHLDALPGAPRYGGDLSVVVERARADALALVEGGAHGVIVENFGDVPFVSDHLAPETIAAFTRCALAVREAAPDLPLGINALRNDALSSLGIAAAVGARFIRVNVLTGVMVTDQGLISGPAAELMRRRASLAPEIAVWADIAVKHAVSLVEQHPNQLVADTVERGLADALIVSGSGTGHAADRAWVQRVRRAAGSTPVLIGSGITADNVVQYEASAYIVGTSLKEGGRVIVDRVRAVVAATAPV